MATNKHAIIRYQTLDKCFRNPGRKYFIEDLIAECNKAIYDFTGNPDGIKRRQIYDDIAFMESEQGWAVPLKKYKDGRKVYIRYEDLSFSINNSPLNNAEEEKLKEALKLSKPEIVIHMAAAWMVLTEGRESGLLIWCSYV